MLLLIKHPRSLHFPGEGVEEAPLRAGQADGNARRWWQGIRDGHRGRHQGGQARQLRAASAGLRLSVERR